MPDLLLRQARLVPLRTGEAAPSDPVDVLVTDDRVAAVGLGLERPAGAEVIEAQGRWLIPGLWDQHVHLGQWTLARQRLDTSAATTPEAAVALVAAAVTVAPGRPVIGWGHRPGAWAREATVTELDAVSGVTPVVLIAGDGHQAWLNSAAQAALGLWSRDEVVRENEWFAAYDLLSSLTGDDGASARHYRKTLQAAAERGIVGLVDLEFIGGVDEWVERWHAGCDLVRIRAAAYPDRIEDIFDRGLRSAQPLSRADDRLTMGPLKIISDGSLNTRTAWCCEPYVDGATGAPNLSEHELTTLLARAHMHGLEVATHAIGDAAVAAALAAYEATGARGSVEHAQLTTREDLRLLAALDLRASVQPAHLLDDRDLTELIWPGRAERCFPFRWMVDAGVRLALGSDAPVSPLDPWLAIAAAVHRSADDRASWHPEQAITPREALAASVDEQPMIRPGSLADLALLDQDPLVELADTPQTSRALRQMSVAATVVAGRIVHRGSI